MYGRCRAVLGTLRMFHRAKIRFVGFDDLAFAAHRGEVKTALPHRFHDAVVHKPSGLVLAA